MRDLINACPGIQAWWREYSRWFSEEFANYVNQLPNAAANASTVPSKINAASI
jgi:hypothetical protein